MKNTIKKQIFVAAAFFLMVAFSACEQEKNEPNCSAIIIKDATYFSVDRTLSNHCADGVDYIVEAESVYQYYDITAKLTIEAGTSILFKEGSGLAVTATGTIIANGNASDNIILKGESDNSVGSWKGLMINSAKTTNNLNYVTIQGAGGGKFNSNDDRGNIVIFGDAKVHINNCTFKKSATYGLNSNYASTEILSLSNNKFENNQTPILIRGNNAHVIDATNTFSGNTNSYIRLKVGDAIESNVIWQAQSIPYRVMAASSGLFPDQKVVDGGSLTINAGTTIEFETETGLYMDKGATFVAVGTETRPIKFTGVNKVAGSWGQLYFGFTQSPLNEIAFATIEYAGSDKGAVEMWADPLINIHDVTFSNISSCAIHDAPKTAVDAPNPKLTLNNNVYTSVSSNYCKGG